MSEDLADALRLLGSILRDTGNAIEATRYFNQSLVVSKSIDYAAGRAHAMNCLGSIAQLRGDLVEAQHLYGQAGQLAVALHDLRLWAYTQQNLGTIAEDQGRADEAQLRFQQALSALEEQGSAEPAMAWVLNNLGLINVRIGLLARAASLFERAKALAIQAGDLAAEGMIEENRAIVYARLLQFDEAESAAARAYGIAEQRHDLVRRAAAVRALATMRRLRGDDSDDVSGLLETALVLLDTGRDVLLQFEILTELGDVYHEDSEPERAMSCWRRARMLAEEAGFRALLPGLHERLRGSGRPSRTSLFVAAAPRE